jgi:fatty acid desaturase
MRSLWASIEISPERQRTAHWVLAVLWFLFFFVIVFFGWQNSVPLLVFISVYANFVGHISSAQAAQVEVKQAEIEKRRQAESNADLDKMEQKVDEVHDSVT